MPRQPPNQHARDSPHSSTRTNESGPRHDQPTRASRRTAQRNSNTHASLTPTDGRTSDGDRTAPHTAPGQAPTEGRLAELCIECECYLPREEVEANECDATATARRGRCNDCHRRSPAPIAPIGGPSYSFGTSYRYVTVPTTESTSMKVSFQETFAGFCGLTQADTRAALKVIFRNEGMPEPEARQKVERCLAELIKYANGFHFCDYEAVDPVFNTSTCLGYLEVSRGIGAPIAKSVMIPAFGTHSGVDRRLRKGGAFALVTHPSLRFQNPFCGWPLLHRRH